MAFALTAFYADGIRYNGPGPKHGEQVVYLEITAADTDVDLDIGDDAGTFWGAVDATALGAAALAFVFGELAAVNAGLLDVKILDGQARYQGAEASGNVFTMSVNESLPIITFDSGSAPTAYTVVLKMALENGQEPVRLSLGTLG